MNNLVITKGSEFLLSNDGNLYDLVVLDIFIVVNSDNGERSVVKYKINDNIGHVDTNLFCYMLMSNLVRSVN